MRPNPSIYSSLLPLGAGETSLESCMLYARLLARHRETSLESCMLCARLLARHRETSPCLIAHCLPQLAV